MAVDGQDQHLQDNDKYQYFMSREDLVRIEIHQDPRGHFVYWRDVQDCFKGLIRVQDGPTFIPMMRDENGYRYGGAISLGSEYADVILSHVY